MTEPRSYEDYPNARHAGVVVTDADGKRIRRPTPVMSVFAVVVFALIAFTVWTTGGRIRKALEPPPPGPAWLDYRVVASESELPELGRTIDLRPAGYDGPSAVFRLPSDAAREELDPNYVLESFGFRDLDRRRGSESPIRLQDIGTDGPYFKDHDAIQVDFREPPYDSVVIPVVAPGQAQYPPHWLLAGSRLGVLIQFMYDRSRASVGPDTPSSHPSTGVYHSVRLPEALSPGAFVVYDLPLKQADESIITILLPPEKRDDMSVYQVRGDHIDTGGIIQGGNRLLSYDRVRLRFGKPTRLKAAEQRFAASVTAPHSRTVTHYYRGAKGVAEDVTIRFPDDFEDLASRSVEVAWPTELRRVEDDPRSYRTFGLYAQDVDYLPYAELPVDVAAGQDPAYSVRIPPGTYRLRRHHHSPILAHVTIAADGSLSYTLTDDGRQQFPLRPVTTN